MDKSRLSRELRNAREDAGMSQSQLASKVGISVDTIRAWEQGTRGIDERVLRNVGALIKALGARADFLIDAMGLSRQDLQEWLRAAHVPRRPRDEERELVKKK